MEEGVGSKRMWRRFSRREGKGQKKRNSQAGKGSSPSRNDRALHDDKVQRTTAFVSSSVGKQEEVRRREPTEDCESRLFVRSAVTVTEPQLHHQGEEVREGWMEREGGSQCKKHGRQEAHSWAGHIPAQP